MTREEEEELLRLTRENNQILKENNRMLREMTSEMRRYLDPENTKQRNFEEYLRNLGANFTYGVVQKKYGL